MNAPSKRWVFFDLGNTLIDESEAVAQRIGALANTLLDQGHRVSQRELESALTRASAEYAPRIIARALELLAVPVRLDENFASTAYRKELEIPYPDAVETVHELQSSFSLGVIANQSLGTHARLASYGLLDYFAVIVASAEEGLAKPSREIFELAVQRAGCRPEDAVMIGDRIDNDIAPAKSLGFRTIRVRRGYARLQEPRSGAEFPDHTVVDLAEIPPLLLKMLR